MSSEIGSRLRLPLSLAGCICGSAVGYLIGLRATVGTAFLAVLLFKEQQALDRWLWIVLFLSIASSGALGWLIGRSAAAYAGSKTRAAGVLAAMLTMTAAAFWSHHRWRAALHDTNDPATRAQVQRKFYDVDGYHRMLDARLTPRSDGSGWDLRVKTSGGRSGSYSLTIDGVYHSQKVRLALSGGSGDTTVFIPAAPVLEDLDNSIKGRGYGARPPTDGTLRIRLEPIWRPVLDPYRGWHGLIRSWSEVDVRFSVRGQDRQR